MSHARSELVDDDTLTKDSELTEIIDPHIPRVDLVSRAANGMRFLLAKSEGGSLLDPDTVRELITKEEQQPMTDTAAAEVETDTVSKADDLDVTEPLADPNTGQDKATENDPGSPAWEAVDAATAAKWAGILGRARNAIAMLSNREDTESVMGVENAGMAAFELDEATYALDYAIDVLGAYVANEMIEAELAGEIGKAVSLITPDTLESVETVGSIIKAGRVLSAANEALLRSASENLQKVLAALPDAPEPVEKKEPTVTTSSTENVTTPETEIEKAGEMQLVYDKDGGVVGVVKPEQIQPVKGGGAPSEIPDTDTDEPTEDELTQNPPAETGVDSIPPADEEPVEKGAETPATIDADAPVDELVKSAEDGDDPLAKRLAEIVKTQKNEIAELMKAPAPGGPIANGGPLPHASNLRGQDNGTATAPSKEHIAELRKAMQEAGTPAEREEAANELQKIAAEQLAAVREQGPQVG